MRRDVFFMIAKREAPHNESTGGGTGMQAQVKASAILYV